MKIHDCKQGTPYWHTIKLGKVSGSMFSVAKGNGQARKDYMEALIDELRTGRPRETFVNAHMQRGTEMEPFARAAYEKKTGVKVQEVGFVEYNENIGVSPDGMIEPGGRLEIKCPTLEVHNKTVQADKVPSSHKPQIQGTLWVTEGKWLDFVSYHPDAETPLFIKRVYPDETYIKELKIRIYMFIADMKAMMKETETDTKGTDMITSGTVQALNPTGFVDPHQNVSYNIDIQSPNGAMIHGLFATKSPPAIGSDGLWEVENKVGQSGKSYVKIKRAQQQDQQPSYTAPQPDYAPPPPPAFTAPPASVQPTYTPPVQPAASYTPPPQTPPKDVQDEIRFAQGLNRACEEYNHDKIAEPSIELRTLMYYEILKTRVFPAALSSTSNVFDTPVEQDDIPF